MIPTRRLLRTVLWTQIILLISLLVCSTGSALTWSTTGANPPLAANLLTPWQPVSAVDVPSARYGHTAVWTGSEMILFGGTSELLTYLEDGGRYDPAADQWRPLSPCAGLPGRIGHTAIWTGSEMIIWGGHGSGGSTDTGARFDTIQGGWQLLPLEGAPSPRYHHTAVWTGTEMIIWGGTALNDQVLGDGARYNPLSNTWTPLPTDGAPSARQNHAAVWTGTEMIIWGGTGLDLVPGGRYNPAANTWSTVTTTSAPYPSPHHLAAAWSGTEMIIWGGIGGSSLIVNDGGRYNPVSDTWSPMTMTGVPSERSDYTEVWTGSEMIVWGGAIGGEGGPYIRNDGGRYDPIGDRWTLIPSTGAPSPRGSHTAVWTGTEMIIWGGINTDGVLGDGARLRGYFDLYLPLCTR